MNDKSKRKRGRGRPATGRSPVIALTLPGTLLARIDAVADARFDSRAFTIRRLLEAGLPRRKGKS
jgi:metal-responsive CopG/Arc/MetJ family transcriptional regulator